MPLQNRVTPMGEIIATPARGLLMGNRGGALHRPDRTLGDRRWISRQWIACLLEFKGRRREVMAPGRYTELFFLDEATALAAGHRPCFECRRTAATHFAALWATATDAPTPPRAADMDRILHAQRVDAQGRKRRYLRTLGDLPAGTMILAGDPPVPHLVLGDRLLPWSPAGYHPPLDRPAALTVEVLTQPCIVAVLNCGYQPILHGSASASG